MSSVVVTEINYIFCQNKLLRDVMLAELRAKKQSVFNIEFNSDDFGCLSSVGAHVLAIAAEPNSRSAFGLYRIRVNCSFT